MCYLTITFRCLLGAPGVSYTDTVETTGSLIAWPVSPNPSVELSTTPNGDGTETVTVHDTIFQTTGSRFIRLKVTKTLEAVVTASSKEPPTSEKTNHY